MIVTGECTACRRAFVARGQHAGKSGVQWTFEPERLRCSHWPDVYEAINLAAIQPHGRAGLGPVRARREPDSRRWTLSGLPSGAHHDREQLTMPTWGLYRGTELIVSVRADDAKSAREMFRGHGLGRAGDRIRRRSTSEA